MPLADVSDDELLAELRRRLDAGRFGWHGLMSTDQADFRDKWAALLSTVHDACNRYPHEMSALLIRGRARELIDADGPQTRAYALNTYLPGIERPEDHQAEWQRVAA